MPVMPSLTKMLVERYAPSQGTAVPSALRARYALLEAWVSILGNIALFALQFGLALVAHSVTLMANAFHTLGDLVGSAVVLVAARASQRPADRRHPYGHGRAEPIATLIIALLLVVTAVEFAHLAYHRLENPQPIRAGWVIIVAMLVSIAAKEWMARFSMRLAKDVSSKMLEADAWHHRSDALAAALVIPAALGSRWGYYSLDAVFGFGVAALIGLAGYRMGREMINVLMGQAPDRHLLEDILTTAKSVRGVLSAHDVTVHDYGSCAHVSLHIEVASDSTTAQSHETATSVEEALSHDMNMHPVVHVDPARETMEPARLDKVRAAVEGLVDTHESVKGFHSLHTVADSQGTYVELHLGLDPALGLAESHALVHDIAEHIARETGVPKVNIHAEPHSSGP